MQFIPFKHGEFCVKWVSSGASVSQEVNFPSCVGFSGCCFFLFCSVVARSTAGRDLLHLNTCRRTVGPHNYTNFKLQIALYGVSQYLFAVPLSKHLFFFSHSVAASWKVNVR